MAAAGRVAHDDLSNQLIEPRNVFDREQVQGALEGGPRLTASVPIAASAPLDAHKELAKRRVFLFGGAALLFALFGVLFEESDKLLHLIDDVVVVGVGLLIVALIIAWRNRVAAEDVHRQNNLFTVLLVIALVAELIAFPIEISDPMDFGNEPPSLIILVVFILNRFIW